MRNRLLHAIQNSKPRLNKDIAEGLTSQQLKDGVKVIDKVLRSTFQHFDFISYEGIAFCSPREQYILQVRKRNGQRLYDHAITDMYMVKLKFNFLNGIRHEEPLLIPFSKIFNLITIRGSKFVASPTFADNLFSLDNGSVFVAVQKNKIMFHRESYRFIANNRHWTADIHHSKIQNLDKSNVPTNRHPLLLLYLLCTHGLTETFSKMFNCDINYGDKEDITIDAYPADKYVICQTFGVFPGVRKSEEVTDIRIAVKIKDFERLDVQSAIAGFFYITDYSSERSFIELDELENVEMWKMAMVFFTWKNIDTETGLKQVDSHLETVMQYLDDVVVAKIKTEGLKIENVNELFLHIIKSFSKMAINDIPNDTSTKYVHVNSVLLFDIIRMISELSFALSKLEGERLTENNIRNCFRDYFSFDRAYKLVTTGKNAITTLDSPLSNLFYKVTGIVASTNKAQGKAKGNDANDPKNAAYPTQAVTHSYQYKTKSSPPGLSRFSPFLELDDNMGVKVRDDQKEVVNNALELFRSKQRF